MYIYATYVHVYTLNPENYTEILFTFYFYTESNFHGSGRLYQ